MKIHRCPLDEIVFQDLNCSNKCSSLEPAWNQPGSVPGTSREFGQTNGKGKTIWNHLKNSNLVLAA